MTWGIFGVAAWIALLLLAAWRGMEGLCKGTVRTYGASYARSESPWWFWFYVTLYFGIVAAWLYLTAWGALVL